MTDTATERNQRFITRVMMAVPHLAALGIGYNAHGPDWAELAMPYADELVGYPDVGAVSNGAIFSLVDSAAGFAVFISTGIQPVTIDLRLDYLGLPKPGATLVTRATCYRRTRQIAFVRAIAHTGEADRPVAHAAGTFMFAAP